MEYLKQFQNHLKNHNLPSAINLWEEYCLSDEIDGEETKKILLAIEDSPFKEAFGRYITELLPLWETLEGNLSHQIFTLIIDLQTTNDNALREKVLEYLKKRHGEESLSLQALRLVGLKDRESFQGAVSHFELLIHMKKGNFVVHLGGWGVGEIMEVSLIREQLLVEFEYVAGDKDISFKNAFNTLVPIPKEHFLARRFGFPEELEKEAKHDPTKMIHILLRDLGPKTALEIKDELSELVIPEKEWTKWWQMARLKMKKDPLIENPPSSKAPFSLRSSEISYEERLQKALSYHPKAAKLIELLYTFMRDFPNALKESSFRESIKEKLAHALQSDEMSDSEELSIHFLLEDLSDDKSETGVKKLISHFSSIEEVIYSLHILAFKKRSLVAVRNLREDWPKVFASLLLKLPQNPLKDYILGELIAQNKRDTLEKTIQELVLKPEASPSAFVWYIQKAMRHSSYPFGDKEGKNRLFESFLFLLSHVERIKEERPLVKKMHTFITEKRYAHVREIFEGADEPTIKEFLLLASKCHSLSDHDLKIFRSLAAVVHPTLGKTEEDEEEEVIWTTQEGYDALKKRIHQIGTVETVENAKEIEVARSHGDLRENSEFKFALEKRDRLQSELKLLSDQLHKMRVLSKEEVSVDAVGVGTRVSLKNAEGKSIEYTLLGPFDTDTEKNIISFQSKIAKKMVGLKVGDTFSLQKKSFTVESIQNALMS